MLRAVPSPTLGRCAQLSTRRAPPARSGRVRPKVRLTSVAVHTTGHWELEVHHGQFCNVEIFGHLPRCVYSSLRVGPCTEPTRPSVLDSSIGKPAAGVPVKLEEIKSADGPALESVILAEGCV